MLKIVDFILFRYTALLCSVCFLASCGGGKFNYDYRQGDKSTEAAAESAAFSTSGTMALPYDDANGNSYASLTAARIALNGDGNDFVATTDTGARAAWKQGWTGKGVKVGIPDDFDANGRWDDHGDWVAIVIGSVAPEADMYGIDMIGGNRTMTADEALAWFEDNDYHIINGSWGISRNDQDTGAVEVNFDTWVAEDVAAFDQDAENAKQALIIYASGNSGNFCAGKKVDYCTLRAAVIDDLRDAGKTAGEKTIWVGSLQDGTDLIANYSIEAGNLQNDFIVSYDDVVTTGDNAGTSFAAPRVTGAAVLVRHKFPNLEAEQIKQVLLQTATDIGAVGIDDIYGHGKLNITGALSPQGTVVPK